MKIGFLSNVFAYYITSYVLRKHPPSFDARQTSPNLTFETLCQWQKGQVLITHAEMIRVRIKIKYQPQAVNSLFLLHGAYPLEFYQLIQLAKFFAILTPVERLVGLLSPFQ